MSANEWLVLALSLAVAITVVRIYSLIRGAVWVARHGKRFETTKRDKFGLVRPTEDEEAELLDACDGRFFPFGVRSYRLGRWGRKGAGFTGALLHRPALFIQILWRFYVFPLLIGLILCILSVWPRLSTDDTGAHQPSPAALWLGLTLGILCMVGMVIIAAEGVFSHLVRQSWAIAYHHFGEDETATPAIREFQVFFGTAILAYIISVCTVTYCALRFGGFPDLDTATKSGFWATFAASALNTLQYLLAIDSAEPSTAAAQLVTALLVLIYIAFILIFFAIILGGALTPTPHTPAPPEATSDTVSDTTIADNSNTHHEAAEKTTAIATNRTRLLIFGGLSVAGFLILREVIERIVR